jgi:hypothetical protein
MSNMNEPLLTNINKETFQQESKRDKINMLFKESNILFGAFFIIFGIYLTLQFFIMKNPHKTADDKKELKTAKQIEESDAYTYDHEKGGDTKLRIITSYVYLAMGIICFTQGGLLFSLQLVKKENIKNNNFLINVVFWGMIISSVLLVIGFSYIFYYKANKLNKKENEKFDKKMIEFDCKEEGKSIIYNKCIGNLINNEYDTCIADKKAELENLCAINIINYNKVKQFEENDNFNDKLKEFNLDENTYTFYKSFETEYAVNCERVVNYQLENGPKGKSCSKNSYKNFIKNNSKKHEECLKKAEIQCKYEEGNIYTSTNQKGTTFSNCAEREKYHNAITYNNLDKSIEEDVNKMKIRIAKADVDNVAGKVTKLDGGTKTTTVTRSSSNIKTNSSIDTKTQRSTIRN